MFGLIDDTKNYLAAQLYSWSTCCSGKGVILRVMKVTGGVTTKFEIPVEPIASGAMPVVIRLKKDGREFRAGLNFEGHIDKDGNPVWIETGSVTSLRPPKTFALTAAQWEQTTGESSFYISAVTIKATTE